MQLSRAAAAASLFCAARAGQPQVQQYAWQTFSFGPEKCKGGSTITSYPVELCQCAVPGVSSIFHLGPNKSFSESSYSNSNCSGTPFRTTRDFFDGCTNQADEEHNKGNGKFGAWQHVELRDADQAPQKGRAVRRWFCKEGCEGCNFVESSPTGSECATGATPLGEPHATKRISCAGGNVTVTTYEGQNTTCSGEGTSVSYPVGTCIQDASLYQQWDSCDE